MTRRVDVDTLESEDVLDTLEHFGRELDWVFGGDHPELGNVDDQIAEASEHIAKAARILRSLQ